MGTYMHINTQYNYKGYFLVPLLAIERFDEDGDEEYDQEVASYALHTPPSSDADTIVAPHTGEDTE